MGSFPLDPGDRVPHPARPSAPTALPGRLRSASTLLRQTLASLGLFLLWQIALGSALGLDPLPAAAAVLLLLGALLWLYVVRSARPRHRRLRAMLGLRPLGRTARWLGLALPLWVLLDLSQAAIHVQLHPVPPETALVRAGHLQQPLGWIAHLLSLVLFLPLLEEIFFRGFIQHRLQRRVGPVPALAISSTLFALAHLEPGRLPSLLLSGLVLGGAVLCTRSLWAGTALHVASNACATAAVLTIEHPHLGRLQALGPLPYLSGAAAALALLWVARRGWGAARPRSAPPL